MPTLIRVATRDDLAFLVDCNAAMALETEGKTLDRPTLTAGTRTALADARHGFYLIAERDGLDAGCLLVTFEWSDWRNGDWWWLQSVYVLPGERRHGVFRALHAEVEARARAAGAVGLRLYVEHENARAAATYRSLGMLAEPYAMLGRPFGTS